MFTSCYLQLYFLYLQDSVSLMFVDYMDAHTLFDLTGAKVYF